MIKKRDIILALVMILLGIACYGVIRLGQKKGSQVVIYVDQKEIGREVKTSVKCNRKTENEQIRRESSKKQGDSRFYRSGQRAEPAGDEFCRTISILSPFYSFLFCHIFCSDLKIRNRRRENYKSCQIR